MAYTMTFDASHKVGRGGGHVQGFMRHIARDADERAGFTFAHANKNIDPDRTHLNSSFVNDGAGGFRALSSVDGKPPSNGLEDYLNTRLAAVKKPLRKDAVVIRGIVLQLDPKWFDAHCPNWRTDGMSDQAQDFTVEALSWAEQEFGQANIVGLSLHLDEHSPQLQLMVTPVTEDGRLSQKDFFKGPSDLKRQHRQLRAHMEQAGYDVEHKVTERSTEHLSSSEFQARAVRTKKELEHVEQERLLLDAERTQLDTEMSELPRLRRKAKSDGYTEGRDLAERDTADARQKASEAALAAERARSEAERLVRLQEAETRRLRTLREDIEQELAAAGPPPAAPSYEEMRRDILDQQPQLLGKFLRRTKYKDGRTLFDGFEDFQRNEFKAHQNRNTDVFGRYDGPGYETWRNRTAAVQRKLDMAGLTARVSDMQRDDSDPGYGG